MTNTEVPPQIRTLPEPKPLQGKDPWRSTTCTAQCQRFRPPEERTFRPSRPGFLLLDPSLSPIYYNCEAIEILAYPGTPRDLNSLENFLRVKIGSVLIDRRSPHQPSFLSELISGRRHYVCRMFSLEPSSTASMQDAAKAVLLERDQQRSFDGSQIATRFHLSLRERETIELLVHGLTSKEIANRMHISPSTVKAFLRIAMGKMGVTTRSGLVGRVLGGMP